MGVDPDLFFVIGMIVGGLTIPAFLSAWTHGDSPRAGAIMVVIAAGLIALAAFQRPGTYSLETTPHVFASVVSRLAD